MPREKKNSRGVYRKDIPVGHDIDGKPVIKQVTSKSLEKFKKKCKEIEQKYFLNASEKFTVQQLGIKWLNTYKKDKIGLSQYNNYDGILRNHIPFSSNECTRKTHVKFTHQFMIIREF